MFENFFRSAEIISGPTWPRGSKTGGCKLIFLCFITRLGSKYGPAAQIWDLCGHFYVRYGDGYFTSWSWVGATTH